MEFLFIFPFQSEHKSSSVAHDFELLSLIVILCHPFPFRDGIICGLCKAKISDR